MPASPLLGAAFKRETDRLTGTDVRDGNEITLLPSGVQSYEKRWELIEEAIHSVHIVSFSFMRDDTTRRLAAVSAEKVRQGVEVKLIVDDAALYTTFSRGILDEMSAAGVEVLTYNSPRRYLTFDGAGRHPLRHAVRNAKVALKRRFHEKYLVVDGREAVLGGMNWGTKYALGGTDVKWWRDTDVHLTGPVVGDVQRRFVNDVFLYRAQNEAGRHRQSDHDTIAMVERAQKDAEACLGEQAGTYGAPPDKTGSQRIRYVGHKPWDEQTVPLTHAFLQLIRTAQRSIYWGCHGIRPPRMFAENLADAAARGVEVHLITNSARSSRSLMGRGLLGAMYWECSHYFRWLMERGVHIHEWQLPGAFHSKNLVVDDKVAAVGSYNLANGSAFHHTESSVIVPGGSFPATVRAQFETDLAECREVTLEQAPRPRLPLPLFDPFLRALHERNLLIDRSLWPEQVRADIDAGQLVWKYSDPP